jgi:hypothetical protein
LGGTLKRATARLRTTELENTECFFLIWFLIFLIWSFFGKKIEFLDILNSINIAARNHTAFSGWNISRHTGWTGTLHDHIGIRGVAAKEAREESGGRCQGTVG